MTMNLVSFMSCELPPARIGRLTVYPEYYYYQRMLTAKCLNIQN